MKCAKTYFAVSRSTIATPSTPFFAGADETCTAHDNSRRPRAFVMKFPCNMIEAEVQYRSFENFEAERKALIEAFGE